MTEDELIEQAKKVSRKVGYVSVSYLQRNMRIGYTRAASLVDKLVAEGFCEKEPTAWRYDVTAQQNAQRIGGSLCECGVDTNPEKFGKTHLHDCPANR